MAKRSVSDILQGAESDIADLATEASKGRDYEQVERLIAIARQLAAMATRFDAAAAPSASVGAAEPSASASVELSKGDDGDEDAPVFERDGNELLKTGKSKEGNVYEHKAPRQTIDALLRAIAGKSTKRGEFRTSRIFPLLDAEGRKLPTYQGYLCLRWLRQIGLVQKIARQRYQMVDGRDPASTVETAWESLHERGE